MRGGQCLSVSPSRVPCPWVSFSISERLPYIKLISSRKISFSIPFFLLSANISSKPSKRQALTIFNRLMLSKSRRKLLFGLLVTYQQLVNASPNLSHPDRLASSRSTERSQRSPRNFTSILSKKANTVQPGQPTKSVPDSLLGGFEQVGNSVVSAQQIFLGNDHLVRSNLYFFNSCYPSSQVEVLYSN